MNMIVFKICEVVYVTQKRINILISEIPNELPFEY
jgi:hypothetical protein